LSLKPIGHQHSNEEGIVPIKDLVTLVAVGDVCSSARGRSQKTFELCGSMLKEAAITFGQLECNLSNRGIRQLYTGAAGKRPNNPSGAKELSDAGFNIFSFASEHTMEWSEDAMLDTINVITENNMSVIGAGKSIKEARKPAIIDCKGTKIGFLAYCSVVPRGHEAGEDKAGLAPIRATTFYAPVDSQQGMVARIHTKANTDDLAAMVEDIRKLRASVDVLVVSMHWGVHFVPSVIAMYQYEVGHAAIDAGADIIIGHHPHLLKGIEVYKGKAIFFSLGNFSTSLTLSELKNDTENRYLSFYNWKIDPNYPNYAFPKDSQKTIMVKCNIAQKKIQRIAFLPCWITPKNQIEPLSHADPRSDEVLHYIEWLCEDQRIYDVKFKREGDEIVILT
jgi:hypothetical protein